MHSQQKISKLPDESEDIFKKSMLDRYMDRLEETFQNWKFPSVNSLCYAEFLRFYYVSIISNENDSQSVELSDDILETNLAVTSHYPPNNSSDVISRSTEMSESSFCFEIFYTK